MKLVYKNISIPVVLLMIISCSLPKKQHTNAGKEESKIELVVLDPGHFHASLLQKETLVGISDTVWIYAPEGVAINQYLENINTYNRRKEAPTSWLEQVYTGDDYLSKMLTDRKGNVVVLAGNNQKKTQYIIESIKAGKHVLSDKPLAINRQDFNLLVEAYQLAKEKRLLIYDLMTERYDILNIVEKKLLNQKELFGELQKGSPDQPSVTMESIHHFFKNVSGKPLIRPTWYYDIEQQGEGIADVTTHLIDLVQWQCFPKEVIHYDSDVKVTAAKHWPTPISLPEFHQSTQADSFPPYLEKYIKNNVLQVLANGTLNFTVKGVHIEIKVIWNYAPPINGGDTFASIKKGSKATLKIIQNKKNNFIKQLYIQKEQNTDSKYFEEQLQRVTKQLQSEYTFLTIQDQGNGLYLVDIPQKDRLGHEDHFSKVANSFLHYLKSKDMPEWENENTLSKYYITTTAVEMAQKGSK